MDRISLWKEKFEKRLKELFKPEAPEELVSAMGYYLFQEGKRIRPLFLIAVSDALGGDLLDAMTAGAVIEIIHNYSLIHDDLPAMDDDDFRRGKPSCHRKFGEALAILAGDGLLTYAFEILSDAGSFRSVNNEGRLKLINVIARLAGAGGMVGGQVIDIRGNAPLEEVSLMKTAGLFEAVFRSAGIISRREDILEELGSAGRRLGLLFQIIDDFVDRDGFYAHLGAEKTLDLAKESLEKLEEELKAIGIYGSEELKALVGMVCRDLI